MSTKSRALDQARAVDARRRKGEPLGLLGGLPVAVKDVLCTQRPADHLRQQDPRRTSCRPTMPTSSKAAPGRRRAARQDEHGRVRHGLVHGEQRLSDDAQSVGPRTHPRRLQRRLGGGGGGLRSAAGPRHRYRRLDSPARQPVRHRRPQADLWPGVALRPDRLRQLARSDRPVRP